MATVIVGQKREQPSTFSLYRTSAGGDESIIVRRKIGEPTDFIHGNSRKLKLQRYYLTLASQHYARLSPNQKAQTRHQFEEIEYQKSHGKTDYKLLSGRQLFIAKDIHSLATTAHQIEPIAELCVFVCDPALDAVVPDFIKIIMRNMIHGSAYPEDLAEGHYLWPNIPRTYETYQFNAELQMWIDYSPPAVPLGLLLPTRYCIMHPGLAVIEHQPLYRMTKAGEDNWQYIDGQRADNGLKYSFVSDCPDFLPDWLRDKPTYLTAKEFTPTDWRLNLNIPNSAFAQRDEPGWFLHLFRIYFKTASGFESQWRIISGESCYAQDGSPPGTYDYLIWPQTLVKFVSAL